MPTYEATPEELEKQAKPADGSELAKTARVCVLADAQANQAFQSAVQSLQQLRQQAAALKLQLDAATSDKDKAYVQGQFDLAMKQLNEANAAATKAYAFNLNRQYVMSIERSSLYVAAFVHAQGLRERRLQPWVIATLMSVVGFFAVLMLFAANPFATGVSSGRADGEGQCGLPAGVRRGAVACEHDGERRRPRAHPRGAG